MDAFIDVSLAGGPNLRAFTIAAAESLVRDDVCRVDVAGLRAAAVYRYRITSSGGAGEVAGSGVADGAGEALLEADVSGLPKGLLTVVVRSSSRRKQKVQVGKIVPGGLLDDYLTRAAWLPDWFVVEALDTYLDTGTAAGWLSKLDAVWFMAAETGAIGKLNLLGSSYPLVDHNGPTHLPWRGWRGNAGAGAYLDTGYALDGSHQYKQDDAHLAVWQLDDLTDATGRVAGASASGGDVARVGVRAYTGTSLAQQTNAIAQASFRVSKSSGLSHFNRASSTEVRVGRDTVSALKLVASTGLPPGNLKFLTRGLSGTESNATVAYASVGKAFTEDEQKSEASAAGQVLLAIGAVLSLDTPETAPEGPNYMTKAMGDGLTFAVYYSSAGPASDAVTETNFNLFPLTGAYSSGVNIATSTWSGDKLHTIWDDRGDGGLNPRPNPIRDGGAIEDSAGRECRTRFTTIAKGMASTEARFAWSRGASLAWIKTNITGPAGIADADVLMLADITAGGQILIDATFTNVSLAPGSISRGETLVEYASTIDKVILPSWRMTDALGSGVRGFLLDAEAHDDRTEAEQVAHFERLKAICADTSHDGRDYRFTAFMTAMNKRNRIANGVSAVSLPGIHAACDVLFFAVGTSNPEGTGNVPAQIANQVDMIRGPDGTSPIDYSKLGLFFQFGIYATATSEQDALDANAAIVSLGMHGVMCWANHADFGGDISRLTVRKQWKLFFGSTPIGGAVTVPVVDQGFKMDFERTDLITFGTGSEIAAIVDLINDTSFAQATSTKRPLLGTMSNGRPAAVFDGIDDCLELTGLAPGLFYGTTGCIIGIVYEFAGNPALQLSYYAFAYGANSANTARRVGYQVVPANPTLGPRTQAGSGSSQAASNSPVVETSGQHWALNYFDAGGSLIKNETDQGVFSPDVAIAINTTTSSTMVRIGATQSSVAANHFPGAINYIEVIPFTTDAATLAAFRARLAQRTVS